MDEFGKLLDVIKDGMTITLSQMDCVWGDNFLIFTDYRPYQTITIHTNRVPYWIDFDGDEPMLLEDCPDAFFTTLRRNIESGNYEIKKKAPRKTK